MAASSPQHSQIPQLFYISMSTQVLQSCIKSDICFSICKTLQSLIFWVFLSKRCYFDRNEKEKKEKNEYKIAFINH